MKQTSLSSSTDQSRG